MRYKVPQNIDMQDRILGPLTMIQFIYAVVGGGFCYGIYMTIPSPFSFILLIPAAFLTVALVFIKVNERPFLDFLLSMMQFLTVPRERVWHHENLSDMTVEIYKTKTSSQPVIQSKSLTHNQISELARKLDKS